MVPDRKISAGALKYAATVDPKLFELGEYGKPR